MAIMKPQTELGDFSPRFKRRKVGLAGEFSSTFGAQMAPRHPGNSEPSKYISSCRRNIDEKSMPSKNKSIIHYVDGRDRVKAALAKFHTMLSEIVRELESENQTNITWTATCAAAKLLLRGQHKWACVPKQIGSVSGVEIGDKFQHRAELKVVGLHDQDLKGIDSVKKDGVMLATSVVASGRYENDVSIPDMLVYTGQGGNPSIGCKEVVDQKVKFGNRALMNSQRAGTPIRVTYQFKFPKVSEFFGMSGKRLHDSMYVYDGLYYADRYWQERGKYGKLVFKFLLRRISGQPKSVHENYARKTESSTVSRPVVCTNDISHGKEKVPIRLMKGLHEEKLPPFDYITRVVSPVSLDSPTPLGCHCDGECRGPAICGCVKSNDGLTPYDSKGRIFADKTIVYECNPQCKCPSSCPNRVTQNGISSKLEVFWCKTKRWGVRSRSYIPKGSFVCEFIGEVLPEKEVKKRINSTYRDRIFHKDTTHILSCPLDITIDATLRGNVGRFVNHSDSPNLRAQFVLYDHADSNMPHVMLLATRDIPPLQELTMDYSFTMAKFGRY